MPTRKSASRLSSEFSNRAPCHKSFPLWLIRSATIDRTRFVMQRTWRTYFSSRRSRYYVMKYYLIKNTPFVSRRFLPPPSLSLSLSLFLFIQTRRAVRIPWLRWIDRSASQWRKLQRLFPDIDLNRMHARSSASAAIAQKRQRLRHNSRSYLLNRRLSRVLLPSPYLDLPVSPFCRLASRRWRFYSCVRSDLVKSVSECCTCMTIGGLRSLCRATWSYTSLSAIAQGVFANEVCALASPPLHRERYVLCLSRSVLSHLSAEMIEDPDQGLDWALRVCLCVRVLPMSKRQGNYKEITKERAYVYLVISSTLFFYLSLLSRVLASTLILLYLLFLFKRHRWWSSP